MKPAGGRPDGEDGREGSTYHRKMGAEVQDASPGAAPPMDFKAAIAQLESDLKEREIEIASVQKQLDACLAALQEAHQRLEIRNLSIERLQAQFTIAADAVTRLLCERSRIRQSRWARLGMAVGFLPRIEDDLR